MEQEQERGITITSAATTCFWKRPPDQHHRHPGPRDFTIEVERSLRVLDGAVACFDGVAGVEPQSETVWRQADKYGVPTHVLHQQAGTVPARISNIACNRSSIALGARPAVLFLPIGIESSLKRLGRSGRKPCDHLERRIAGLLNSSTKKFPADMADEAAEPIVNATHRNGR